MSQISSARTYRSGVAGPPETPGERSGPGPLLGRRWWTLSRMVAAGTVAVLLAVGVAGAFLYLAASHLSSGAKIDRRDLEPASTRAVSLQVDYLHEQSALRGYLLSGQTSTLDPLDSARADIPGLEADLRREVRAVPGAERALDAVEAAHTAWAERYEKPQLALVAADMLGQARDPVVVGMGQSLADQIDQAFGPLQGAIAAQVSASDSHIRQVEDELVATLVAALVMLAVVVVSAGYLTIRHITLPVAELTEQLIDGRRRRFRRGAGEISRIVDYAEAVRSELAMQTQRSRQAIESLRLQSPTVAALVDALAPRLDHLAGITVASRLDPAEGLLAGDWYDVLAVGPDEVAVVVGDVAGHGPVSAVLALRLRETLSASLMEGAGPGEALRRTARSNERGSPELFATVFVAVLDVRIDRLNYANAGHPPGLLRLGGEEGSVELGPTGPLLSPILANASWDTVTRPFEPGAGLLVVTDGATEGRDRAGEEYGTRRLRSALDRLSSLEPSDLVDRLASDNDDFVGHDRADDRTLVYCRHTGR